MLRSPHSRRLWRAAWSGDEQRFRSKFNAAGADERRNLVLEVDPTSGWNAACIFADKPPPADAIQNSQL